jgi:truncated hemoglobin YjbI
MTSQEHIKLVVEAFYAKATTDVLIGYHFRHVTDFATHLPRIRAFWEMQLLGTTEIALVTPLDVLRAHVPLKLNFGEVGRWVKLFNETLQESEIPADLRERWSEKVSHFQGIFERSPLLFPPA